MQNCSLYKGLATPTAGTSKDFGLTFIILDIINLLSLNFDSMHHQTCFKRTIITQKKLAQASDVELATPQTLPLTTWSRQWGVLVAS